MSVVSSRPVGLASHLRPRRLRRTPALRSLVRETRPESAALVAPLFVRPGRALREPISSLPGQFRFSVDEAVREADRLAGLGVAGIILFLSLIHI